MMFEHSKIYLTDVIWMCTLQTNDLLDCLIVSRYRYRFLSISKDFNLIFCWYIWIMFKLTALNYFKWTFRCANKKVYVFLYGVVGLLLSATYAYFNATITTLEKRYKIPSRNTGIISVGNDISQLFVSSVLSYYAGKGHRPRWMAVGKYNRTQSLFKPTINQFVYLQVFLQLWYFVLWMHSLTWYTGPARMHYI